MALYRFLCALAGLCCCVGVYADTVTDSFAVTATVTSGCVLGSSGAVNGVDFGTINFGSMVDISNHVDIASSSGAGSVIVTCTPGTSISLALDYGLHNGSSSARYVSNGTTSLAYQLYRDSSHSQVWGTVADGLAYNIASFPSATQTYTVYARLFATATMPATGTYTDTVTVTLTY